MKTFIQREGLDFSNSNVFGEPKNSFDEFKFLISYVVNTPIVELEQKLYYRITEDNYLQLASITDIEPTPYIVAQFKETVEGLKSQLQSIIIRYFENMKYYIGFPCEYIDGTLFSMNDFEAILESIKDGFKAHKKEAQKNPPELFSLFEKYNLAPQPDGRDEITWLAICPRCRRHLLMFKHGSLSWMCGYCHINGTGTESFEQTLMNISEEKSNKY